MNHLIRKRVFTLFLAGILAISLAACGNTNSDGNAQDISSEAPQTSGQENGMQSNTSEQVESSNAGSDGSNILIAYFTAAENSGVDAIASASYTTIDGQAVGRVRAVADMIQENVGGDLFSIHTSVVYPTDGGELIDYAAEEQDENARPELTSHIDNLDQYDTIFIGYPNWWADLPMAVYSFFDEYDFSGKTVIPFATSGGSGMGKTLEGLKKSCNGNLVPGSMFNRSASLDELRRLAGL